MTLQASGDRIYDGCTRVWFGCHGYGLGCTRVSFWLHTGMVLATHGYGLDLTGMHYAPNLLPPLAHWVPFTLFKNNYKDVLSFPQIKAQCTLSSSLGVLFKHLKDLPQFVSVIKGHVTPCSIAFPNPQYPQTPQNGWMELHV